MALWSLGRGGEGRGERGGDGKEGRVRAVKEEVVKNGSESCACLCVRVKWDGGRSGETKMYIWQISVHLDAD